MHWRPLQTTDLKEALAIHPGRMGAELIGPDRATRAWEWLVRQRAFQGVAVYDAERITGIGAAVFVKRQFAEKERCDPQPLLNSRIIESVDSGQPVVLTLRELAGDNTDGALQLVILYANWRRDLTEPQVSETQMLLASSFLQVHDGYRLNGLIVEAVDEPDRVYLASVPTVRFHSRYEDYFRAYPHSPLSRQRALGIVHHESCMSQPGTVGMPLFQHRTPTLGLADIHQTLLLAALEEPDEKAIAEKLTISKAAVRWRWTNLFQHVSQTRSDVVPHISGNTRGPEKRSRILSYVRAHPEELRPFAVQAKKKSRATGR